ncbi:hypothetical protein FRB99_003019 [Tulasnella sp. 403]|nr:hypothetical protein FRB99_003019 [Tulasnella sp. 403]
MKPITFALAVLLASTRTVQGISSFIDASSYISDWIPVNYTVQGNWGPRTKAAQQEIVAAAQYWNQQGPWSVLNKTILPPTGNKHDYLSWSPYWWPDCSNVKNTTALTDQEVWTKCNYFQKDGQFNPDRALVNDTGSFAVMSDAVFYNVLAYKITGDGQYASSAAHYIDVWFLNNATYMTPNLEYSQVIRGANGSKTGTHTGVLDLHCITKIVSGILVLRAMGAAAWTPELDTGMKNWTNQYLNWLQTNPIALEEKAAKNNHGSFYFSQTASLLILMNDFHGAKNLLQEFFDGIYKAQIDAKGEQPFEAERTRAYHYRAYNAGAIITIHRIAEYLDWNSWNITTAAGTNIRDAVNFAMTVPPDDEGPSELYPNVAAVAAHFGDPDNKYASWLAQKDKTYPGEAWFFWNQPLSDSGISVALDPNGPAITTSNSSNPQNGKGGNQSHNAASAFSLSLTHSLVGLLALAFLSTTF